MGARLPNVKVHRARATAQAEALSHCCAGSGATASSTATAETRNSKQPTIRPQHVAQWHVGLSQPLDAYFRIRLDTRTSQAH
jgi:hypothetical protein